MEDFISVSFPSIAFSKIKNTPSVFSTEKGVINLTFPPFKRKPVNFFWIVGLLDCWIVGLLDCWIVGLLDCWIVGLLDCWIVGLLDCWIPKLNNSTI